MDAVGRDDVAEAVVVIAEELWEVVEEDEENSEGATVQAMHWLGKLSIPDVENNQILFLADDTDIHLRNGLRNLKRAVSS